MNLLNLDKNGWRKVSFGEVCRNVNETERDPLAAGIERCVGLEHIEPENLHIKSWGSVADGTTFTKKFRAGQVLFGRRRAYQKKAAVADFEGICSGDILVLEADPSVIDPQFFPFLVSCDRFFDFAVQTSAGSLSPRTKFQDLSKFEFLLPPKSQQARFAELLLAGDLVLEGYFGMKKDLKKLGQAVFASVFDEEDLEFLPLGECLEYSQYGISEPLSEVGEIPVLRMNNIFEGRVLFEDLKYVASASVPKLDNLLLKKGDILFNRTNSFELVGKVGIFESDEKATFASYLIRLKADEEVVLPKFLNYYLNSKRGQDLLKIHRTPGVSQSNINPENLKKIDVPIVPVSKQEVLVQKLIEIETAEKKCEWQLTQTKALQNQVLNQIFSQ